MIIKLLQRFFDYRTPQAGIKPKIFLILGPNAARTRPKSEPDPKSPARITTVIQRSASLTLLFGHKQHYREETNPMLTSDTEDAPLGCSGDSLVNEEMKTTSEQQEEADGRLARPRSIPFFKGKFRF